MYNDLSSKIFKFSNLEKIFGIATFISLVPQILKLISTKRSKDFSMPFIIGLLLVNVIYFIIGFTNNTKGLMLGSFIFVIYNAIIIYYYYFGIQK